MNPPGVIEVCLLVAAVCFTLLLLLWCLWFVLWVLRLVLIGLAVLWLKFDDWRQHDEY